MLTLADRLRIEPFTLFRDVIYKDGARSYTARLYALPDAPRLARDQDGGPAFGFVWYRTPAGEEAPGGGGMVTLTVELGPSSEEKERLAAAVAAALPAERLEDIEILSMPFRAGTVSLAFAGEEGAREGPTGDFAARVAGSGPARLAGSQRATFTVELTRDGAALLHQCLERGLDLFHARYDLLYDYRLDDVELRIWCDARGEDRLSGVEVVTTRHLDPEEHQALERIGHELLDAALAGGDTVVDLSFTQAFPVEGRAALDGTIRLGVPLAELANSGQRVRQVDLEGSFFTVLEVPVHCTVDFSEGPIETVRVKVEYDVTGPAGRVHTTGEYLFSRAASGPYLFRTALASPGQRTVRCEAEVFYAGNAEPLRVAYPPAEGTAIVLDLDRLGVLRVEVGLRDVPLERIRAAVVDLEIPPLGLTHRMVLDGETPAGLWQPVTRVSTPPPFRYRATWLTAGGERIETEWRDSTAGAIALDAPRSLVSKARVQLVGAGDFSGLAQIVVDLEAEVEGRVHRGQLAFSTAGESRTWEVPGAQLGFRYRSRFTLVGTDGAVRSLEWVDQDGPVLVVRDPLRFEVRIVSRLLDLGGSLNLALLALEPEDAEGAGRSTLILRRPDEEAVWSFGLAAPDRHRYRWQLTLIPKQGERTTTPWQEAEAGVLVLRPPAQ
ncbi:MAG TPA: hypothetical protein VEL74_03645 [Thermoanaerobaculia bacterium]|nr:hypothetical protein [Thermoanaerobaculia bacterium]